MFKEYRQSYDSTTGTAYTNGHYSSHGHKITPGNASAAPSKALSNLCIYFGSEMLKNIDLVINLPLEMLIYQ